MKIWDRITTPYGVGFLLQKPNPAAVEYLVAINKDDYLGNYPPIPTCDGTHINILVPAEQVEAVG